MKERLQKIISSRGLASRRQAEQWIIAGRVTCNGQVCQLGDQADPDIDCILADGKPIPSAGKPVYLMLHKPRGYVTTLSDEKGRANAAQLVEDCGVRVYPIGRLDMDSEGLLLFTNDGEFANCLMHPKHQVEKAYQVTVRGFTESGLETLKNPAVIDGYTVAAPQVKVLSKPEETGKARLEIVICEGRNRQVRKMCALAGMDVIRLIRVREGSVLLGSLPRGKWRYLTDAEIEALRK
ncbi:MAG: rRNA pseudouridine synthase [Oscillospiraceae bacterium]|nr:rRNA pseudouridine synthase [Oscillospiraceae bacterium]